MAQQWDVAHTSANITLSGSPLLTATLTVFAQSVGVCTELNTTGKFYWEDTCSGNGFTTDVSGVGVANDNVLLTNFLGSEANAIGFFIAAAGDGFWTNGAQILATPNLTNAAFNAAGGLICIAWDATNKLIWVRFGIAGNWNGNGAANPATGVGGAAIPAAVQAGGAAPAGNLRNIANPDKIVSVFAQANWQGVAPAGFGPFDIAGGAATQAFSKYTALTFLPPLASQYSQDPYQLSMNLMGWAGNLSNWSLRVSNLINILLQAGGVITNGMLLIGDINTGKFDLGTLTAGANIVVTTGPGTITLAVAGILPATLTAHGVLVGEGTSPIVAVGPGAANLPLIGQGAADPIFSILPVAGGGTNLGTLTAHAVLIGEGTASIAFAGPNSVSGALFTSAGSAADPAFVTQWTASSTLFRGNLNAASLPTPASGDMLQLANVDGVATGIELVAAAGAGKILSKRSEGTIASPTATTPNVVLGTFNAGGYANGAYTASQVSMQLASKTNNWTGTDNGTRIIFFTVPDASVTSAQVAELKNEGCSFQGTTTNDNAAAGFYGEYISSVVLVASGVGLTSNVIAQVATITITPGDWEIWGEVWFSNGGANAPVGQAQMAGAINGTSATFPGIPSDNTAQGRIDYTYSNAAGAIQILPLVPVRASFATSTNYFLNARAIFTAGNTCTAYGKICARRIR